MRTIKLAVNPRGYIIAPSGERLGRAGEIGASRIEFDVSGWAENTIATYSIAGKNAAGLAWVLESGLTATDGIVSLDVPDALVSMDGYATVEIRGEASGAIIKTAGITLYVEPALTTGTAPTGAEPAWIDRLSQAGVALGEQIAGGGALRDEMQGLADQVDKDARGVVADRDATHGYMKRAETAAVSAEGDAQIASDRAAAADGSALRAEAAYSRIVGLELAVDVADGLLCLYSSGLDSPIDIAINGQTLEVWKV